MSGLRDSLRIKIGRMQVVSGAEALRDRRVLLEQTLLAAKVASSS